MSEETAVDNSSSVSRTERARSAPEPNGPSSTEKKEIGDATNRVNGAQVQGAARMTATDRGDDFRTNGTAGASTSTDKDKDPKATDPQATAGTVNPLRGGSPAPEQQRESDPALRKVQAGETVLKKGSEGPAVAEMQRTLNTAMPGSNLPTNGKFDQKTEDVVKGYQQQHGLNVDGRIDSKTLESLRAPNAAQMQADPAFKKLDAKTQADVTSRLEGAKTDPAARRNISSLATSEGFGKLGSEQQRRMLEAQGKAPKDAAFTRDLKGLANSENFRKLDQKTQEDVTARMEAQKTDPGARQNISSLATSEGFGRLGGEQQRRMLEAQAKSPSDPAYTRDLVGLANNRNFQKLDAKAQGEVTNRIEAAKNDPGARQNISSLATSEGFGRLGSEQQRRFLEAQSKAANDAQYTRELTQLANNPNFQKLSPEMQNQTADAMAKQANNPFARATIAGVAGAPGFGGLSANDQQRMMNLISGNNPQVSEPGRNAANQLINSPSFKNATPAEQTKQLQNQLTTQPGLPQLVRTNGANTPAAPYTISAPTDVKGHPFRSGAADGKRYNISIDGRQIPVTIPNQVQPGQGQVPTIDQVANGIATLPKGTRDLVNSVTVNPGQSPADAYWAKAYNNPSFRSYMDAGAAGDINVYPTQQHNERVFKDSLVHETGHIASQRAFGVDDKGPGWNGWRQAMAKDGFSMSTYARSSPQEDFSEALTLYQGTRGDAASAAELRKLFPERYKILDRMFGGS